MAASLAVAALALIVWGPPLAHFAALLALVIGALREYLAVAGVGGLHGRLALGGGVLLALASGLPDADAREAVLAVLVLVYLGGLMLARPARPERLGAELTAVVTGWLYLPFLLGHGARLLFAPGGRELVLFLVLVTTSRNAFAAHLGRRVTGRPISPHNPRKTWAGAAAGTLATLAVVTLLALAGWQPLAWPRLLGLTLLLALVGQVGDLVGSMFKRLGHVTSSGGAFGAQGGFLDLVDSYVFGAPALWLALRLLG